MPAPTLGVLIRFSDSASTLPAVLAALKKQTLQPDVILGVNSGGTDASSAYIRAAGGRVANWTQPYAHASVLNFGLRLLPTDLVLILSSHTVLESPDTLAWGDDPFDSDAITFTELQRKGLRFGSFYSNCMGLIRRRHWQKIPFDESIPTAEDYAWAIEQLQQGHTSLRLRLPFTYRREGASRAGSFARVVFHLARRHSLKVNWLGPFASLKMLATHQLNRIRGRTRSAPEKSGPTAVTERLGAWLASQFAMPN